MSMAGRTVVVVEHDVASQPVSIHLPLNRLLPDLLLALMEVPGWESESEVGLPDAAALMELPLRVFVLAAQSDADMWKRNGYYILNQLHNYRSSLCRYHMLDKDLLLIQVHCSMASLK